MGTRRDASSSRRRLRHDRRRRRRRNVAIVALVVIVAVGTFAATRLAGADANVALTTVSRSSAPTPTPTPTPTPGFAVPGLQDPSNAYASAAPGRPTHVRIPSIGVDADLEDLAIAPTGQLKPPTDDARVGWYAAGVQPGEVGPAILAGHVDSETAPAVFARLGELKPGDAVIVTTASGRQLTFAVTALRQSPKASFPTADVYSNVPDPEVRLITCAGTFDRSSGHYLDNLVVFASLQMGR